MEDTLMFFVNSRAIIERYVNNEIEIVVQDRNKTSAPKKIELPGGRIEMYESLTAALRREVKEETGLDVYEIEGEESRIDTSDSSTDFVVECVKPFAAYQTTTGPIDSVGYYFRCKADGELLNNGDDSANVRWVSVNHLANLMNKDPLLFSDVDRAGIKYYLKEHGKTI